MAETPLSGGWSPVSAAPRDGTPVILWLAADDAPPALPLAVGFWTADHRTGAVYWRLFGDLEGTQSCSDEQIRAWRPLLRADNL
jgi:hypothetical protein